MDAYHSFGKLNLSESPYVKENHNIHVLTRSKSKAEQIFPGKKKRVPSFLPVWLPNGSVSGSFNLFIFTSLLPTFSVAPSIMPAEWQA
ncbi:hypothetical protein P8452_29102 [Trifolium repens]|nr:hypothetical protein P8452_29102 [Trifolium repens]